MKDEFVLGEESTGQKSNICHAVLRSFFFFFLGIIFKWDLESNFMTMAVM